MPARYPFVTHLPPCVRGLLGPLAAAALALLPLLTRAGGPGWQPGFHTPGLNGDVYRVVQWQGRRFVAGGDFTAAAGQPAASHVARWDGRRWRALGTGPGFAGPGSYLCELLALPGGDLLAAGGRDDTAAQTGCVTRWDGTRWRRLGAAFDHHRLVALAAGPGDALLLAADPARPGATGGLHRWDGRAWRPLEPVVAAGQQASAIRSLVVLPAGDILATGYLRGAGGAGFQGVGRWTGTTWQPLGPALPEPYRYRLLVAPDGGLLLFGPPLAGGAAAAGAAPGGVLRWDGRAWLPGAAPPVGAAPALVCTPNGEVLAPGRFTRPGDTLTYGYARYDGTRWQVLGLPRRQLPADPDLVAVSARGEVLVNTSYGGLRGWDGRRWLVLADRRALGIPSRRSSVRSLAVDRRGRVVLGGYYADPAYAGHRWHVSRWNGRRRRPLGPGFHSIRAVALTRGGQLFVRGSYQPRQPGEDTIRQVGRWRHGHWHAADQGLPPKAERLLPIGGDMGAAGCGWLRRWHRGRWQPDPAGPADSATSRCAVPVLALPGGELLSLATDAEILASISQSRAVLRGRGGRWQVLGGEELPFDVLSVAVAPNGDVYAAGEIRELRHQGTSTSGYVLRWDGQRWQALGEALSGSVNAVAVTPDGRVYIGGAFEDAGGNPRADYVARWAGGTWQALGAGLNGEVHALVVAPNGTVIVGGDFTATGDEALPVWHWGMYRASSE